MVQDRLDELYRNVQDPFSEIESLKETDLYKLWEQHKNDTREERISIIDRIRYFLDDPRWRNELIIISSAILLLGVVFLLVFRKELKREEKERKRLTASTTGTITHAGQRSDGKKAGCYCLVEFLYNGFKYTQGYYLPDTPQYKTGSQVTIMLDPGDVRVSAVKNVTIKEANPFFALSGCGCICVGAIVLISTLV